ncbi:hypothetical protein HWV62_41938 [Athelia sp. TMB]|nr:hypothetical protein HWV62_41938 [Athelia sp. TMB]
MGFDAVHYRLQRRAPQAASTMTASASSTSGVAQATVLPMAMSGLSTSSSSASFKGMVIIVAGFIALLLAFVLWKIVGWRRNRAAMVNLGDGKQTGFATKVDLEASFETVEKPHTALIRPVIAPASSGVGWVPQIKSELAIPSPTKARSDRAKQAWEKNLAEFMAAPVPTAITYHGAMISKPMPTIPPMPTSDQQQQPMPPTPPAFRAPVFEAPAPHASSAPDAVNERRFPRLMDVATAFTPSLDDELSLALGETIRLLEEFEDSWCLVQRVGRRNAPQGVVPRFCLVERPQIVHKGSLRRDDAYSS